MRTNAHARRGTMYVAVLGCMSMIAVIGVTALTVGRIEMRSASGTTDLTEARFYAQSAVEMGARILKTDPNWRTTMTNGRWKNNIAFGEGSYSLDGIDPIDGTLANSKSEPVRLKGTGVCRQSTYILQATAMADRKPLDLLRTSVHAGGTLQVLGMKTLSVSGGPASANGSFANSGTIAGNVEAVTVTAQGIVVGTVTSPSAVKEMPASTVVDSYIALATTIANPGDIDRQVLSPGVNPWGATNADGVYYINATSADLVITNSRIHGTLVVRCGMGRKVRVDDVSFLKNYRADYPALIVDGDLELRLNSATTLTLSEVVNTTNYNPAATPYLGVTDADVLDVYPNEIRGLVHATGTITLDNETKVNGVVLGGGTILVKGLVNIVHDNALYTNPPIGYETYEMNIAPGSWQRVVLP